jgi:hypothetical protein
MIRKVSSARNRVTPSQSGQTAGRVCVGGQAVSASALAAFVASFLLYVSKPERALCSAPHFRAAPRRASATLFCSVHPSPRGSSLARAWANDVTDCASRQAGDPTAGRAPRPGSRTTPTTAGRPVHQRQALPLHGALLVLLATKAASGSPKPLLPPRRAGFPCSRFRRLSPRRAGTRGPGHGPAVPLPLLRRRRHRYARPALAFCPGGLPIAPHSLPGCFANLILASALPCLLQVRRLS